MDRNLRLLGVGAGIRTLGAALYYPFLALFLHSILGVGYVLLGAIFVGVGLIQLPFGYAGGLLTDRIGRRRLIVFGLGAEAVATVGLAYTFSVHSLIGSIAIALLSGAIGNATGPATPAYVADFAEGSARTLGMTWYRIGYNAGFSAGVAIGGIVAALLGFPAAVLIAAVIIGVGAVFLAVSLAPSPFDLTKRAPDGGPPLPGAVDPGPPRRSTRESIALFVHDRLAVELLLGFVLTALIAGQWNVTFALFVHDNLGVPYALLGIGLAINGVVVVFGQSLTTHAVLGWRHTTIGILGCLLYVVAFLGLAVAGAYGLFVVPAFFLSVVVLTVGENLLAIPQSVLPSNLAPPGEIGAYNGAFNSFGGLGYIVAIFLGGVALATTSNPIVLWLLLTAPAVVAVVLLRHAAARAPPGVDRA